MALEKWTEPRAIATRCVGALCVTGTMWTVEDGVRCGRVLGRWAGEAFDE